MTRDTHSGVAPAQVGDVVDIFGPLDDLVIADVLALRPSRGELLEARAWLDMGDELGHEVRRAPSPTVERLIEILEVALQAPDEES